tara:strand:+ start:507 stop:1082 length:576 start_codon:yes stop_codon:yes gene_type:complete
MYDKEKARSYYQKNKAHILKVHQDWAKKNVDQSGSVWRRYGRRARIKNPNLDKEYYAQHRQEILYKKKIYYRKREGLMYKPLPDSLTIAQSGINGLGLFAKEDIAQGTNLGMTHLELGQKIIRTPLGGFINHANTPNCVKIKLLMTRQEWNHLTDLPEDKFNIDFKKWNLVTLQDIKEGEELTVRYTFYKI